MGGSRKASLKFIHLELVKVSRNQAKKERKISVRIEYIMTFG